MKNRFGKSPDRLIPLLFLLLIALPACTGAPEIVSVLAYQNCERLTAGVKSIDYSEIATIRGSVMLDYADDASTDQAQALKFLALSKGVQPTSGYALRLANGAQMVAGNLQIPVIWETPLPDSLQAQMLTHPCLIVALDWPTEKQNDTNIDFIDQNGEIIATYPQTELDEPISAAY